METQNESLWLFALLSKCTALSPLTIFFLSSFLCLSWLALVLLYWAEPGGPAWGKYRHKIISPRTARLLPLGPRGYPLIGSMDLMMGLAHHKLTAMADLLKLRRLMAFSLGDTRVVITCNPDVAKEILCSSVFADRPIKESAYSLMFNRAMGFAPYGVYWTTLRRIAANHMFSPKQINSSQTQRANIASQMVEIINHNYNGKIIKQGFCVREMLKLASLINMMGSVFGRRYELTPSSDSLSSEAVELSQLVLEGYELLGKLNWSDHLPWLGSFDIQRIRERCSGLVPRVNRFVNRIISEHRVQERRQEMGHQDFVDVLLSLNGPDKLSDSDMVAVLWEMIFRGTDTVAVLIEWILARMILHPEVQSKVQDELDKVVGKSRPLMESDIPSLSYLQAVIKEVLRLHPPGPLLSWARLAISDTTLDGYHIPAGTTAMVNMWEITRDPQIWVDPLRFHPERFDNNKMDFSVLGSDLRLAPFGSGRRSCPGKVLGLTTVTYWVGNLLHEFVWTQCPQNPVTLTEVMKLSCEMVNPLFVIVHPRRKSV